MNLRERVEAGQILSPHECSSLFKDYKKYGIDEDFIEKYKNALDWTAVLKFYPFTEDLLEKYIYKSTTNIHRTVVASNQVLSEEFMEKHYDRLMWSFLSVYQKMSKEFIEKHRDRIDFAYLPLYQESVTASFLEEIRKANSVSWRIIATASTLTEAFILEYAKYLDPDLLRKNTNIELTDSVKLLLRLNE
jgi:hypothetical protein